MIIITLFMIFLYFIVFPDYLSFILVIFASIISSVMNYFDFLAPVLSMFSEPTFA
jgi:hypothetical protein